MHKVLYDWKATTPSPCRRARRGLSHQAIFSCCLFWVLLRLEKLEKPFSQLFFKGKVKSTPISGATSGAFFVTPKPLLSFSTTFLLREYCTSPIICASP